MKKALSLLLLVLVLFVGCGETETSEKDNTNKEDPKKGTESVSVKELKALDYNISYSDVEEFEVNGEKKKGTQIADSGIFYVVDKEIDDSYVYGESKVSYANLYYGILNDVPSTKVDFVANNPAEEINVESLFDVVSSATSQKGSHSDDYPKILDYIPGETENDMMRIEGIRSIDSRMNKKDYVEAMILKDAKSDYAIVKSLEGFELNEDNTKPAYNNNVFTLLADGSYSKPETVDVGDAPVSTANIQSSTDVKYDSKYGDYEFEIEMEGFEKEDSSNDLFYPAFMHNIYAMVVTNSSDEMAGAVYYEDIWVEEHHFGEIDLALTNGEFDAHKNVFTSKRFEKFFNDRNLAVGEYKVKILSRGYEDIEAKVLVKEKLAKEQLLKIEDVMYSAGSVEAKVPVEKLLEDYNPTSDELGKGRRGEKVEDYTYDGETGSLVINNPNIERYKFTLTSDKYQPIECRFVVKSNLTQDDISVVDNKLVVADGKDTSTAEYLERIGGAVIFKKGETEKLASVRRDANKLFNEDGSLNGEYKNRDGELIFPEKGEYTIQLSATGYEKFEVDMVVE